MATTFVKRLFSFCLMVLFAIAIAALLLFTKLDACATTSELNLTGDPTAVNDLEKILTSAAEHDANSDSGYHHFYLDPSADRYDLKVPAGVSLFVGDDFAIFHSEEAINFPYLDSRMGVMHFVFVESDSAQDLQLSARGPVEIYGGAILAQTGRVMRLMAEALFTQHPVQVTHLNLDTGETKLVDVNLDIELVPFTVTK